MPPRRDPCRNRPDGYGRPHGLWSRAPLARAVRLHGRIFGPEPDPEALAVRRFNDHALADDRVTLAMLPIADGLTLARRK
jgi:hypothetical protein